MQFLDAPRPDLKEVRETLADVGAITQRAGEVIRGLRDMLKRDTAGFAGVDLHQLIRTVERIAHGDANQHGVNVVLDLPPGACPVNGDASSSSRSC
jgi:C4-dicarboxylate-specific signal transduction histidine kinase